MAENKNTYRLPDCCWLHVRPSRSLVCEPTHRDVLSLGSVFELIRGSGSHSASVPVVLTLYDNTAGTEARRTSTRYLNEWADPRTCG
jgi:hypothetical protein